MTSVTMTEIANQYQKVKKQISQFCHEHNRNPDDIRLIAVSKRHGADKIEKMYALGQKDFGENYLQEATDKIQQLENLDITWHFIGHIQSRKCKQISENFDWVHTVSTVKVANKLNDHRSGAALNVLIQLNLQQEDTKSGISQAELLPLAKHIMGLENLRLQGLMIIPMAQNDFNKQLEVFSQCAYLLKELQTHSFDIQKHPINQLSMGMTDDMSAAIAAGSTMLRIGTAIFGARD